MNTTNTMNPADRIGQSFTHLFGRMQFIYTIEGIEKAGDVVTDDSYKGKKTIIYRDLTYTDVWYSAIKAFEALVESGHYKQVCE